MSEKNHSNGVLNYTSFPDIEAKIKRQRDYFSKVNYLDTKHRIQSLEHLLQIIRDREDDIMQAMHKDFRKCNFEAFETEIGLVISELNYFIRKLPKWNKRKFRSYSIFNYPGRLYSEYLPLGNTLIISPWNYPFLLTMTPLIGCIAAGNTAIVKPSEMTRHTASIMEQIFSLCFDPGHVDVVQGGPQETQEVLKRKFDFIFFTGSTRVGQIVYKSAAEYLTPTLLELGGKSPCIVNIDADIEIAAKRIAWGKLLNGGQTCVAPDYVLVHKKVKDKLLEKMAQYIRKFYGDEPSESRDFPRIINKENFQRITALLENTKTYLGGDTNPEDLYISPTIVELGIEEHPLMKEEIFGPVLPVLEFESQLDINRIIAGNPYPLALYVFSDDEDFANRIFKDNPSGDACINDVVSHFGEKKIGVGGLGSSGIGKYHGRKSFEVFSHERSILKRGTWPDLPLRYPPYQGKLKILKTILSRF